MELCEKYNRMLLPKVANFEELSVDGPLFASHITTNSIHCHGRIAAEGNVTYINGQLYVTEAGVLHPIITDNNTNISILINRLSTYDIENMLRRIPRSTLRRLVGLE